MSKKSVTRRAAVLCMCIFICLAMAACGGTESSGGGQGKYTELMKDWQLLEFSIKGETTRYSELLTDDLRNRAPKFRCDDGLHCVFSNNLHDYTGTVSIMDGKYYITYDTSKTDMAAEITGNKLTIESVSGTMRFVFVTGTANDQRDVSSEKKNKKN